MKIADEGSATIDGLVTFTASDGRVVQVQGDSLDEHNLPLLTDPDGLATFIDGMEDFADGRFTDIDDLFDDLPHPGVGPGAAHGRRAQI